MFRRRDPNRSLFESTYFLPEAKRARLSESWAEVFQRKVLPLIDEGQFAPMYCQNNGAPNKPVQIVLSVLVMKDLFDLTDMQALEQLEFNLLWHHALRLTPDEAHLCQKTLHNFRVRLLEHDGGRLAFTTVTDRILEVLGTKTNRQRLDSTHIVSNFARLTRLGLFCETIRVFLNALRREDESRYEKVPASLRARYIKEDREPTRYEDAASSATRRRLGVCARDVYRLVHRFRGTGVAELEAYGILVRLFEDQCVVVDNSPEPGEAEDDIGEESAPAVPKEPKLVSSGSLQTPHDPDVTYSGHKGKGYEVQIAETCAEENATEIITHVAVTSSCDGDANETMPTIEALTERELQPEELLADTSYGSAPNSVAAQRLGTELVTPVAGPATETAITEELSPADFDIDPTGNRPVTCPSGQVASEVKVSGDRQQRMTIHFDAGTCAGCALAPVCPVRTLKTTGDRVLHVNVEKRNLEQRRRQQGAGEFKKRYDLRAGIEATNSELKRRHGLGRLRVRRGPRVKLAVYLKALACNVKRAMNALLAPEPAAIPVV